MRAVHRVDDALQAGRALEHLVERAAAGGRHGDDHVMRRVAYGAPLVGIVSLSRVSMAKVPPVRFLYGAGGIESPARCEANT